MRFRWDRVDDEPVLVHRHADHGETQGSDEVHRRRVARLLDGHHVAGRADHATCAPIQCASATRRCGSSKGSPSFGGSSLHRRRRATPPGTPAGAGRGRRCRPAGRNTARPLAPSRRTAESTTGATAATSRCQRGRPAAARRPRSSRPCRRGDARRQRPRQQSSSGIVPCPADAMAMAMAMRIPCSVQFDSGDRPVRAGLVFARSQSTTTTVPPAGPVCCDELGSAMGGAGSSSEAVTGSLRRVRACERMRRRVAASFSDPPGHGDDTAVPAGDP